MLISELVEFLVGLEETYGDIIVCHANDEMIHSFKKSLQEIYSVFS